jgi:hypothetical protein
MPEIRIDRIGVTPPTIIEEMPTTEIITTRAERSAKAVTLPAGIAPGNTLEAFLFFGWFVNVCCLFDSLLQ